MVTKDLLTSMIELSQSTNTTILLIIWSYDLSLVILSPNIIESNVDSNIIVPSWQTCII